MFYFDQIWKKKNHRSSLEKMYKQKNYENNSAYFSLFIFEWVVLDKNVKKEKNKVNVLLKQRLLKFIF